MNKTKLNLICLMLLSIFGTSFSSEFANQMDSARIDSSVQIYLAKANDSSAYNVIWIKNIGTDTLYQCSNLMKPYAIIYQNNKKKAIKSIENRLKANEFRKWYEIYPNDSSKIYPVYFNKCKNVINNRSDEILKCGEITFYFYRTFPSVPKSYFNGKAVLYYSNNFIKQK
jgi:hypothetical protein